jgi:hypothetical protein
MGWPAMAPVAEANSARPAETATLLPCGHVWNKFNRQIHKCPHKPIHDETAIWVSDVLG